MDFFLCVLGMVLILEGIPYFAFPEKMKAIIREVILPRADGELRTYGIIMMAAGLLLVFFGRR
jgi:hypothetical protein